MKDENGGVRRRSAAALGRIDSAAKGVVAALADALKHHDERVRHAAAVSLGRFGAPAKAAVPALIDALKDEDNIIRSRATDALKKIDPESTKKMGVP